MRDGTLIMIACLAALAVGFGLGTGMTANTIRREAVRHGAAIWAPAKDGSARFYWLDEWKADQRWETEEKAR